MLTDPALSTMARPHRVPAFRLGLLGSILLCAGAPGAGATMANDPLFTGTVLGELRHGPGRALSTTLLYLGVGLLILAWVRLGREVMAGTADTRGVTRAVLWWTVPLLLAPPLFSTDLYSYLAQGVVADSGFDPYSTVPAALSHPIIENPDSHRWLTVTSPYGPLFVLVTKIGIGVTGGQLLPAALLTRLLLASGLVLLCVSLPRLCDHLGGRPANALWLGAANPFVLLVLVSGAHNDLLMVGLLARGTLFVLDHAHVRGFALVATAAAVKVTAAVALPFLVWIWVAHRAGTSGVAHRAGTSGVAHSARAPRRASAMLVPAASAVATVVGVFGLWTVVAGVDLGWISALGTNSWVETWLSIPTAAGKLLGYLTPLGTGAGVLAAARLAGWVVLAGLVGWLWWRSRDGGPVAIRGAALALLVTALFNAVTFPWYLSWPLALAAAMKWRASWTGVAAGLSVWLLLTTHPDGATLLPWWGFAAVYLFAPLVGLVSVYDGSNRHKHSRVPQAS
ncbi:polyprenol phosphomannose-dependent alpha 1,6 mannosyltransferase MptB [Amycolatopsis sp. NBC_00345]|uniref:polyprenol phosphomannose-dependent alpha 1,6 mannosyltransferase MptB n=1 Tax=Amycolatopsis sp. NBC_00345 TaxID=2975955 RepID=UPI002E26D814